MTAYTKKQIRAAKNRADEKLTRFFFAEIPALLQIRRARLTRVAPSIARGISGLAEPYQESAEDYINGGFLNPIWNLYKAEERSFIKEISHRFERVKLGFAYFSLLPPLQRQQEALRLTELQLRTGWQYTGVPLSLNQSVKDHHESGKTLATLLFPDDPRVALHFSVHDVTEPVVGDFTPYDEISKKEKTLIEALGVKLIAHSAFGCGDPTAKLIVNTFDIYDGEAAGYGDLRSKMRDCDLLDMALEMVFVMGECSGRERQGIISEFQEFWDNIGPGLTHQRSKDFFAVLQTARHGLSCPATQLTIRAAEHMYSKDPNGAQLEILARSLRKKQAPARPGAKTAREGLSLSGVNEWIHQQQARANNSSMQP